MSVDVIIIALMLFFSFVTAFVFSNVGLGGGLLYMPILTLLGAMSFPAARPISLAFAIATTGLAAYNHAKKDLVDFRLGGMSVIGTLIGTVLGYVFIVNVPENVPGLMFSVFIMAIAAKMIYDLRRTGEAVPARPSNLVMYPVIAIVTITSGFLSISLGIGGGVLLVPLFIYIAALPTKKAAGTSSFTAMFTTMSGLMILLAFGGPLTMDIPIALFLILAVVLGAFIGSRWGIRELKSRSVLLLIVAMMMLSSVLMALKYLGYL